MAMVDVTGLTADRTRLGLQTTADHVSALRRAARSPQDHKLSPRSSAALGFWLASLQLGTLTASSTSVPL